MIIGVIYEQVKYGINKYSQKEILNLLNLTLNDKALAEKNIMTY